MTWFFMAATSALLSAVAAILQKKILKETDALSFSFMLSIFNVIFALPLLYFVEPSSLSSTSLAVLYGKTVLGTFAFYNVMLAIKNLDISRALPLLAITPGLVAIFAFLLLGDAINGIEAIGVMLLILGTYLLELKNRSGVFEPFKIIFSSKAHRYILAALLLFTTTSIVDKLLLSNFKLPPITMTFFQQVFLLVNFGILVLFTKGKFGSIKNKLKPGKFLAIIALVSLVTLVYRYTQFEAVKLAPVALVISVKRTSIFFATVIGGKLFVEDDLLKRAISAVVILVGAALILYY